MHWQPLVIAVRNAYRDAPNKKKPISPEHYVTMLSAFGALLPLATITSLNVADFRRNLAGGGISGIQVISLTQSIAHAAQIANTRPLHAGAGEGIAENIMTMLDLVSPIAAHPVLEPHKKTFQTIASGNL